VSRYHVNEVKPVVGGFAQPRPVNSVVQPIDLTGIGVPEDGQKMISELMSMYDRNVQGSQASMVMETLQPPTVQNHHQEHLQFQGNMVEGSFFEDLNIPNRGNNNVNNSNQTFFQGSNSNGFKFEAPHHNSNNNFEGANINNNNSNRFQLVFDSTPFDMASFDYRDDMTIPGVMGTMDGIQQKQQDVSIWF
jgi:ethylene-insensitive protein 3